MNRCLEKVKFGLIYLMSLSGLFSISKWYSILFWLGAICIAGSAYLQFSFIDFKLFIGLGFGLMIVGFSNIVAEKTVIIKENPNLPTHLTNTWQGPQPIHNLGTKILFGIGVVVLLIFLALILWVLMSDTLETFVG